MWPFNKKRKVIQPYDENAEGDFYVVNQSCITCGAPQAEAPDLIDHSKKDYGHCFFKKQPQSEEEIEQAINAIAVSCVSALRYGGRDEKILKRLYEIGEENQCDYKPIGKYKLLVWDRVYFKYTGSIQDLYCNIIEQISLYKFYLDNEIFGFTTNDKDYFEFIYRWTEGFTGVVFKCYFNEGGISKILLAKESDAYLTAVRSSGLHLNLILSNDKWADEIEWYDLDRNCYKSIELK